MQRPQQSANPKASHPKASHDALKIAFRRLARSPGFCVVSVLMLTLGVAVSTLMSNLITFAAIGLLIALIGRYAMMSQTVNERRREIGVRLALGAHAGHIRVLLLGGGGMLLLGALVGLACSYVTGALLI